MRLIHRRYLGRKFLVKLGFFGVLVAVLFGTTVYAGDLVLQGYDPSQKTQMQASQVDLPTNEEIHDKANQLFHNTSDPEAGNPKGHITLVEFFDYRCVHSIRMTEAIADLIKSNPDLRVVFKDFPIFGNLSVYAAKAALAAKNQGKYYEFHEALMLAKGELNKDKILAVAKQVGLDTDKLLVDMKSSTIDKQLKANQKLANSLSLNATPIFFIAKTNVTKSSPIDFVLGEVREQQLQLSIIKV